MCGDGQTTGGVRVGPRVKLFHRGTNMAAQEGCTDTALTKNRGKLDPKRGCGARWASDLGSILPPVCVCASGGPDGAAGSAWAGSGAGRLVEWGRVHH